MMQQSQMEPTSSLALPSRQPDASERTTKVRRRSSCRSLDERPLRHTVTDRDDAAFGEESLTAEHHHNNNDNDRNHDEVERIELMDEEIINDDQHHDDENDGDRRMTICGRQAHFSFIRSYKVPTDVDWSARTFDLSWLCLYKDPICRSQFNAFFARTMASVCLGPGYSGFILVAWAPLLSPRVRWFFTAVGIVVPLLSIIDVYLHVLFPITPRVASARMVLSFLMSLIVTIGSSWVLVYLAAHCSEAVSVGDVRGRVSMSDTERDQRCVDMIEPYPLSNSMLASIGATMLPAPNLIHSTINMLLTFVVGRWYARDDATEPTAELAMKIIITGIASAASVAISFFRFFSAKTAFESTVNIERQRSETAERATELEQLLKTIVPAAVLPRLIEGGEKQFTIDRVPSATMLFADMKSFTAWSSSRAAIQVTSMLNTVVAALDRLAWDSPGVDKIKTVGDAYWAVSGIPVPTEDHADQLVHFGWQMNAIVAELNKSHAEWGGVSWRVGIHSGVMTGALFGERQVSYEVFGETSRLCQIVEASGVAGEVCVTPAVTQSLLLPPDPSQLSLVATVNTQPKITATAKTADSDRIKDDNENGNENDVTPLLEIFQFTPPPEFSLNLPQWLNHNHHSDASASGHGRIQILSGSHKASSDAATTVSDRSGSVIPLRGFGAAALLSHSARGSTSAPSSSRRSGGVRSSVPSAAQTPSSLNRAVARHTASALQSPGIAALSPRDDVDDLIMMSLPPAHPIDGESSERQNGAAGQNGSAEFNFDARKRSLRRGAPSSAGSHTTADRVPAGELLHRLTSSLSGNDFRRRRDSYVSPHASPAADDAIHVPSTIGGDESADRLPVPPNARRSSSDQLRRASPTSAANPGHVLEQRAAFTHNDTRLAAAVSQHAAGNSANNGTQNNRMATMNDDSGPNNTSGDDDDSTTSEATDDDNYHGVRGEQFDFGRRGKPNDPNASQNHGRGNDQPEVIDESVFEALGAPRWRGLPWFIDEVRESHFKAHAEIATRGMNRVTTGACVVFHVAVIVNGFVQEDPCFHTLGFSMQTVALVLYIAAFVIAVFERLPLAFAAATLSAAVLIGLTGTNLTGFTNCHAGYDTVYYSIFACEAMMLCVGAVSWPILFVATYLFGVLPTLVIGIFVSPLPWSSIIMPHFAFFFGAITAFTEERYLRRKFLEEGLAVEGERRLAALGEERVAVLEQLVPKHIVQDLITWFGTGMDPGQSIARKYARVVVAFIQLRPESIEALPRLHAAVDGDLASSVQRALCGLLLAKRDEQKRSARRVSLDKMLGQMVTQPHSDLQEVSVNANVSELSDGCSISMNESGRCSEGFEGSGLHGAFSGGGANKSARGRQPRRKSMYRRFSQRKITLEDFTQEERDDCFQGSLLDKIKTVGDLVMIAGPFPELSNPTTTTADSTTAKKHTSDVTPAALTPREGAASQHHTASPAMPPSITSLDGTKTNDGKTAGSQKLTKGTNNGSGHSGDSIHVDDRDLHAACEALLRLVGLVQGRCGVRVGAHIGPVVGTVQGLSRLAFDTFGDVVNVASRLMSSAQDGAGIQVSRELRDVMAEAPCAAEFEGPRVVQAKGKGSLECFTVRT